MLFTIPDWPVGVTIVRCKGTQISRYGQSLYKIISVFNLIYAHFVRSFWP